MYNHSADENKSNEKNDHSWMEEQFSQNDSNLRDSMSNNDVQRKRKPTNNNLTGSKSTTNNDIIPDRRRKYLNPADEERERQQTMPE